MIELTNKNNSKDSMQFPGDFQIILNRIHHGDNIYTPRTKTFPKKKDNFSDLTEYFENLPTNRLSNSLMLRRPKVPIKIRVKPSSDSKFGICVNAEQFIQELNSNNSSQIIGASDNIAKLCEINPSSLSEIASDLVIESYINAIDSSQSEDVTKSLLISLAALFPLFRSKMVDVVDSLYLSFSQILETATNSTILPAINLIISISKHSSYGRNSLLSAGIHELLISIAKSTNSSIVAINCCIALEFIFTDATNLDFDILIKNGVMLMIPLLSLPFSEAKESILSAFASISSQVPIASNVLCESAQIHLVLLGFLSEGNLLTQSFRLLRNICIAADIMYVKQMVENGFVATLVNFVNSERSAAALHLISLLIDRLREDAFVLLPPNFNDYLVELAYISPFEVKKQITYLIATEMYVLNQSEVGKLMKEDTIKLLVDMLSSGQNEVTFQCLNALGNVARASVALGKEAEYAQYLDETDLLEVLDSFGDDRLQTFSDRAISLIKKLEPILSS